LTQFPVAPHDWGWMLVAHCVSVGPHTPWQEAEPTGPTQVWWTQGTALPHIPLPLQVCSAPAPEHCVLPEAQMPWQEAE
jgi:hypothetical protein